LTYLELLSKHPDYRRLWLGQVVSEIGDWLNNTAVLALTIQLAGAGSEGSAIAIYAISRHLPLFLFGPLAGVVVDRVDRRRVMIAADLSRAILALGFLLANFLVTLPMIYVVGASLFAVSAFFNAAKRATIPNIVNGAEALLGANSLSASTTAATIAVGSALGGVIATFVGRNAVFVINAATYLVSAELIRRIRANTKAKRDESLQGDEVVSLEPGPEIEGPTALPLGVRMGQSLRRAATDFREGLRYVRRNQILFAIFIVAAGWGLGNGVARALYSIFGAKLGQQAVAGLLERPTDFGIAALFVAMGLGGLLGAPLARRFNSGSSEALGSRLGRSLFFDGACLAIFAFMPTLLTAALVLVVREMNFAIWWTAQQTLIMSRTDNRYAGRVFASYETLTTLMMVGSMMVAGATSDRYGIKPVAAAGGVVVAFSGLLWFVLSNKRNRAD
jgi:MFS family permease